MISQLTLLIYFTLIACRGGSENFELITGMSYDFPNMISSEFWSNGIKIEDLKINPINPFNSISTKGWSQNVKPIYY